MYIEVICKNGEAMFDMMELIRVCAEARRGDKDGNR